MERLMKSSIQEQIQEANTLLGALLFHAREALCGREDFTFESIQAISLPLKQMAPLVARAAEMRAEGSELTKDLEEYAETLSVLQATLEQVQFMLLARQTSLEASRSHAETMNLWATRLNQTR
jgi:hypothetical protein